MNNSKAKEENKDKKKGPKEFLALIFLLIGIGIFVIPLFNSNQKDQSAVLDTNQEPHNANTILNEHLQSTYDNIEISKKNVKHTNEVLAPTLEQAQEEIPFEEQPTIYYEGDDLAHLNKDLSKEAPESYKTAPTLHNQIMTELKLDEEKIKRDKTYRSNYAKRYIAKAKEKGFIVTLDDDFKITSVHKIEKSDIKKPSIFDIGTEDSSKAGQGLNNK